MDILKEIIKELTPFFKQMGFSKKGNSFYLEVDKNYGVVNFQKSRDCTKEVVKFTINFGVYSDVLGQEFDFTYCKLTKPDVWSCQWWARVGTFMPGSPDSWWHVSISDNLNNIVSDIMAVVQNMMPEINKRLSDEGLINCWLNEKYYGTTEIGRFQYLITLLKAKGDLNTIDQVVETFMQQPKEKQNVIIAKEYLKEIGYEI